MNQPTREEFEAFKTEMREEVRKLKEQRTDEMKAINVNVSSADVLTRLDELEQKIDTVQEDTNRVTIQMEGARADILRVGESQADLRDTLKEHSEDLKIIKEEQQTHKELLGQIIIIGENHTKRFDTLETDISGLKTDVSGLKTDVSSIKSTQEQILKLLQERGE